METIGKWLGYAVVGMVCWALIACTVAAGVLGWRLGWSMFG